MSDEGRERLRVEEGQAEDDGYHNNEYNGGGGNNNHHQHKIESNDSGENAVIGSAAMRPVFLGNLVNNYSADEVQNLFERPIQPQGETQYDPIPVDRVDLKRGYCFVFLKDAKTQQDKERVQQFVVDINGMELALVSQSLRAEFARGDGRVKRKEDERRQSIQPSETLFVVNFHEATTRKEDLQMLFEPFGELVRIDMKRNYAFVQFKTIAQATEAKERTNGGKLDQSVLTVEYVARERRNDGGGGRGRRDDRRRDDRRGGRRDVGVGRPRGDLRGPPSDRYDDRRRAGGPPPGRFYGGGAYGGGGGGGGYGGGRYDEGPRRGGGRSPPRRSRSRSRSPPGRYRSSRSPPPAQYERRYSNDRYDDYRGGGNAGGGAARGSSPPPATDYRARRAPSPPPVRGRGGSPPRDPYRDNRGYRP